MALITNEPIYTHGSEWRTPAVREADRQKIAQEVDAWLAAGNQPTEVPFGLGASTPNEAWAKMGSLGLTRKK